MITLLLLLGLPLQCMGIGNHALLLHNAGGEVNPNIALIFVVIPRTGVELLVPRYKCRMLVDIQGSARGEFQKQPVPRDQHPVSTRRWKRVTKQLPQCFGLPLGNEAETPRVRVYVCEERRIVAK